MKPRLPLLVAFYCLSGLALACDPVQTGELGVRRAGSDIVAAIAQCDWPGRSHLNVREITLRRTSSEGGDDLWRVVSPVGGLMVETFRLGEPLDGFVEAVALAQPLQDDTDYVLTVRFTGGYFFMNSFKPSKLKDSSWWTFGNRYRNDAKLKPERC